MLEPNERQIRIAWFKTHTWLLHSKRPQTTIKGRNLQICKDDKRQKSFLSPLQICIFRPLAVVFCLLLWGNHVWVLNQAIRICLSFGFGIPNNKDVSVQSCQETVYLSGNSVHGGRRISLSPGQFKTTYAKPKLIF